MLGKPVAPRLARYHSRLRSFPLWLPVVGLRILTKKREVATARGCNCFSRSFNSAKKYKTAAASQTGGDWLGKHGLRVVEEYLLKPQLREKAQFYISI